MFQRSISYTALLVGLFAASAAVADLTADRVWVQTIDMIEEAGGSITALATRDGDNLNISNVRFTFDIPDTDETVIVSMDGWSLLEKGGKVHVEQPDYQEIVVKVAGQDDVTARLGYSVREDMGVYSEVEDTLIQTWDIASAEVKLIELIAPDYDPAEATVEFVLSMNDAMSNMMYMGNGHQQSVQSLGEMAFDMTIVAPAEDVDLTASARMRGLMSEAFQTVNFNGTPDQILAELKAGGGLRATSSLDGMEFKMDGKAEGEVFDISFVADKSASNMNIDNGNASVSADINNISFNAFVPAQLPLPLSGGIEKIAYDIDIPLAAASEMQQVHFGMEYLGLGISDTIWAMFDPTGQLDRAPIDLIVDLSAGVRLDRDLIDPNIEELMEQDPTQFGSIESFGLNELLVSALGAVAIGSGDFTFDMNDLQTFDGIPRPEGEASIVVSGLNSVFDQLIEAGLLQPDQLMPIRMGLGMGFVATGEDELTSEVEVRSNGGVYVNGQRMR
ncbi:MAG: DUF2125 domain-containing protein [Rhodobacteraceae bacterium]|nr:DUF2125 domain-containing protein [Paracoccaceae bacterium]